MRDRSKRLDQFLAAHADAVVFYRQAAPIGVNDNRNAERRIDREQRRIRDRLVAKPFAGIGCIRNELTYEYVSVRIDRVHDQIQQLGDISLKGPVLLPGLIDNTHITLCPSFHRKDVAT
jgi:hypothetical protein